MQSTHNQATDEIREEMAQMRTELGLVLKHVTGGPGKINDVNYLSKNHRHKMMSAIMRRIPMQ